MNAIEDRARSIFLTVLECPSDEWPALLDEACGFDAELRKRVDELLDAHRVMGSIHGRPVGALANANDRPIADQPGAIIGPYKLLEQIGEGGFGVVFMAEQQRPVRRKVALKVLKPGMDTRQVVARFEAERQALALMDHPYIAKVFDGGTTETGRPYFVMELVRGEPITAFCDRNSLAIRQRLELFVDVCQAVQHAHQKGIIHRDIKPSNVMITLHDGKPVVKVIDFGVAKALGQQLTEKTLFTNLAQMIGTPLYMSPEQAEMSGLDVDTRSDIYSLGVLLYELLAGSTPFESERLSKAGYDEMRRIIREEEPPRPSARISTVGKLATTVGQNRHGDSRKLSKLFRGELDWIVMKALEKDRDRRYETASAFAADVQRYLHDEPVQACPPSVLYRFQKFTGRNKGTFATVGLLGVMLLLGVVLLMVDNAQIKEEQRHTADQKSRAETALNEAEDNLRLADENLELALQSLDEVYMKEIETRVHRNRELGPADQEFLEKGLRFYEEFGKRNSSHAGLQGATAKANRRAGYLRLELKQYQEAEAHFRTAIPLLEKLTAAAAPTAAEYRRELASARRGLLVVLQSLGRYQEAEAAGRQAIALYRQIMAEFAPERNDRAGLAQCLVQLHLVLNGVGQPRQSETSAREALAAYERLAADFPGEPFYRQETAHCCRLLAYAFEAQGRVPEAALSLRRALSIYAALAAEFPARWLYRHELAYTYFRLGGALQADRQTEQAEQAYRQAVSLQEKMVKEAPQFADHYGRLASFDTALVRLIVQRGGYVEAAKVVGQRDHPWVGNDVAWGIVRGPDAPPQAITLAVALARKAVELDPSPSIWNTLGVAQYRAGDWSAAIDTLLRAEEMYRGWNFSFNAFFLAMAHWQLGEKEKALKWYGPALVWMEKHSPRDEELLGFRAETAGLLGLGEKLTPEQEAAKADDVKYYDLVLEARPDAAWACAERGSAQAQRGQWKEAAADFAKAVELNKDDPFPYCRGALLCLQRGDVAGYRELCGDMLGQFSSPSEIDSARWVEWTCVLGPDAVSDWKPVVELAEKALTADTNNFDTQQRFGAVLYRAGRFHDAASWLTKAETVFPATNDAGSSIIYNWLFRAMTEHRLGHAENAKTLLEKAVKEIEQPPQDRPLDGTAISWHRKMTLQLLRREAEDVLMKQPGGKDQEGAPSDDDWRIVEAQARAWAVVGETTRADEMRQRAAELRSEQPGDSELQYELARSHSELAKLLQGQGKRGEATVEWNYAAAEYQKVVEQWPDAWEGWSGLAFVHFHQQQWEDAVAAFSKAVELNPAVHTNWWHRGHCYLNLQQWDKAATEFGYIVDHWPSGGGGWCLRGVALAQLNRPDEALADLRQAIAKGFQNVQFMQKDSRLEPLRAREDFRELLQEFERTQVQHQDNLALEKRQLAEEAAKLSTAIRESRRLAAEQPDDSELQHELARSYSELAKFLLRQGRHAEAAVEWNNAAAEYQKAIEQWPDAWEGWSGLAFAHFHQQQWEDAVAPFSKAIELNPAVLKNWWHRGNCYLNLEQWDKAATEFGYIVDHWPNGGGGWYLRGVALAQLNRPDEALADLRQAIAKGFHDVQFMQKDSRLEPLRAREDFRELLQEFERTQKSQVQQDGG